MADANIFTSDSFTDSAGTLLETHVGEIGATWTKNAAFPNGSAAITSANRLRGAATNGVYFASGVPAIADYDVEADGFVASITGAFGLIGRQNSAAVTYYLFDYEAAAVAWKLYAIVNGTTITSVSFSQALTIGQTYHLRLSMRGSSIVGYVNGVAVVSLTDSNITAAGRAGVFFGQADTDSTGFQLDNYTVSMPIVSAPTDANLHFSPYNWYSDGAGPMQSNNIRASSTLAKSNAPGAYLNFSISAVADGFATLLLDTSSQNGITPANCPTIIYSLDGQAYVPQLLAYATGTTRIAIPAVLSAGSHTLGIFFRGCTLNSPTSAGDRWNTPASCVTITGVELDGKGSATAAIAQRPKKMLIYGDSMTEGADAVGSNNANADQDASQTYGQLLAASLNAEVGIVGFSAQGWVTGGYGNVPQLYNTGTPGSSSFSFYSAGKSRLISGAFSPAPDYVAVMHGHNDSGSSDASVTAAVTTWIGVVRAAAPAAKILVIVEFDGIKRAAVTAGVTAAGDPQTYLIDLGTAVQPLLASGGAWTNDGIHPNVRGHAGFASLLDNQIDSLPPTATKPSYTINFTVTLPPISRYPIRMAQNATDPVVWAFIDTNGNPVALTGKTLSLTVYLDTGATQVQQFNHTTSTGLAISQNEVTWTPQSTDTQVAQILKYVLTNTTDGQALALGSLSVFPV